ncbi:MFS transporter [Rhodoglobus sp. NPDC076762]
MDIDRAVQSRIVRTLVSGQVLAGLGLGATVAVGAILAADLGGEELSGAAATSSTLGAALVSIPLARLAQRWGRRPALALGAGIAAGGSLITVVAVGVAFFPLLILGFAMLGVGTAVGLQARFAATDVAAAQHRGRDLSLVVWSTTIGAVAGPNLVGPGEMVAQWLSLPTNTGSFVFAIVAQLAAMMLYIVALRPDPLTLARNRPVDAAVVADAGIVRGKGPLVFAIAAIAISHAVMVSIMAMTPVHLSHHGASLTIIGFTISLHIAGMYALSPVFGWASDRFGRIPTILMGQGFFAASVVVVALGELSNAAVTVGLVLLGLGWSASTVAGSALVADLATGKTKLRIQGRSDTIMSLAGALGGGFAGPILAMVGYAGLAWGAGVLVLIIVVAALVVWRAAPLTASAPASAEILGETAGEESRTSR